MIVRIRLDLPDPFAPTSAVTPPEERTRSSPWTRVRAPYRTSRPAIVRVVDMECS